MVFVGLLFGKRIAESFFRYHMHDTTGVLALGFLQDGIHFFKIVSVDGTEVNEPQIFKNIVVDEKSLGGVLQYFTSDQKRLADNGNFFQKPFGILLQPVIPFAGADTGKIVVQTADVAGYGHIVIVENDDQIELFFGTVVQRLIDHAVCQRAVTDDRDGIIVVSFQLVGLRDAECGGDRGAAVTFGENIVLAFSSVGEAGDASSLAERMEAFISSRQELMRVALMADVENDFIIRRAEMSVQGDGCFRHSEIGSEMSAVGGNGIYDLRSYFRCKVF